MISKSRKVAGYVKALLKHRKLQARLDAKMAKLNSLEDKVERAGVEARNKLGKLNGGQIAEAKRIVEAM